MFNAAAYRDQLLALLPLGAAWSRNPASWLGRLMLGLGDELARVDRRAVDLLDEADPRTALELLPDWERVTGLPDECVRQPDTLAERRLAVVGRLTDRGGQSKAYFTAFAAAYGYQIAIEECTSSDAGSVCAGDPLADDGWRHVWIVHVELGAEDFIAGLSVFTAGDGEAGDRLSTFGAFNLSCLFDRAKPAHTLVHFTFGD